MEHEVRKQSRTLILWRLLFKPESAIGMGQNMHLAERADGKRLPDLFAQDGGVIRLLDPIDSKVNNF